MSRNPSNQMKDELNQTVQFHVLNDRQCERIVNAALEILERTGCCMKNERAREIFRENGCAVDGERVRIPAARRGTAISCQECATYTGLTWRRESGGFP